MATKAEVRNKTLIKLGVLSADGTADTNDATLVEDKYDDLYQYLVRKRIATWGPTDEVPNGSIEPVVVLLANRLLSDFNLPLEKASLIKLEYTPAFNQLNEMALVEYTQEPLSADYF